MFWALYYQPDIERTINRNLSRIRAAFEKNEVLPPTIYTELFIMAEPKKPKFECFTIKEAVGRNSKWTKIGAVWENKDGSLTVELDAMPVSPRLVLLPPKAKEETAPEQPERA